MIRRVVISLALIVPALLSASSAEASPPKVGCPPAASGFFAWNVNTQPYQADNAVDVNGDTWVCAKAIDGQTFTEGGQAYQIYNFVDDVIPA
jgi:hypothetical protein